jgi:hypothetical protein
MYGFQQQQFGLNEASMASQNTLATQQFQNQMGSYGIQNTGLYAQRLQDVYNAMQKESGIQQQTAGAGSYGSLGRVNQENVNKQALSAQQGALDRDQQQLYLQMVGAQQSRQNQLTQEFLQGRGLNLQEQQAAQQNTYSQQQIADARQKLGLDYQQLGLSQSQANAGYQNALNKLGLNQAMSVQQLETEIAKAKAGMYTPITQYLGQLMAAGAPIVA